MLMPALQKARLRALRVSGASNLGQMVMGFTIIANDRDGTLPRSNRHPWGFGPWYFRMDHPGLDVFDNRVLLEDYGFVNATAHPVIGTPPITDPPNDKEWATAGPWHYLPGYLSPNFAATTGRAQGPLRLYRGSSEHEMMQDMMIHALGHPPPLRYQAIQVKRTGVRHIEGGSTNPSHAFFGTPGVDIDDVLGAYCGFYDGSVRFYSAIEFEWAEWNGWGGGLFFGHRQKGD
jgi:hypothetical protein